MRLQQSEIGRRKRRQQSIVKWPWNYRARQKLSPESGQERAVPVSLLAVRALKIGGRFHYYTTAKPQALDN
jgi:hypothetical protein